MNVVRYTLFSILSILLIQSPAISAEINCLECHEDLAKEKFVHPALKMGCTACHTGIDAQDVPHKKTNKITKGLSLEQPELCYKCHDKTKFTKKTVHAALEMGCTSCHNPHSSKYAKLLIAEAPALCLNCHEKAEFSRKNVHVPVAEGMCLTCHSPHSTDNAALLLQLPIKVCLECHADVRKTPHATTGFESPGHPIGLLARGTKEFKDDPARPGKKFYCGSCHNPHSSDSVKLFRYKGTMALDICINCHKK
jgi:predicted CXXCH cytochrome family protein